MPILGQRARRWAGRLAGLGLRGAAALPVAGLGVLALTATVASPARADAAAELRAACDAPAFAQVLRPAAQRHDARAVWLDRRTLQWPAMPADGRYRLYHAAAGGMHATPGALVAGADSALALQPLRQPLAADVTARFRHVAAGVQRQLTGLDAAPAQLQRLHRGELLLVQQDDAGRVLQATGVQSPGALDDLYAAAARVPGLGVQISPAPGVAGARTPIHRQTQTQTQTSFRLWAPTAQQVWLCRYPDAHGAAGAVLALQASANTGVWQRRIASDLTGQTYRYLVDVWVPGTGQVRQRVTDPYAISLSADSQRTWIGSLDAPALQPPGWAGAPRPAAAAAATDQVIYELHLRDFSISDASVAPARRGKYSAFTQTGSHGMQHLAALARAGLTDVHLLPVFDLASVPEQGCTTPSVPDAAPDSPAQQVAVMAGAATDCFNWGYDPLHFNAPEGSYASQPDDGAVRIREFRQMVMALHRAGLRVGMDVVYNHLAASGQQPLSVLDRIVPGYYHRLDAAGQVERSSCCDNSATEHRMMARLMQDSVRLWARQYRIDAFRFDLMGHQPRAAMLRLRDLLRQDNRRNIPLLGEGWNFGEVADGARFVQASQLQLGGTGIATFNDRLRDALRGGAAGDGAEVIAQRQGYLNGLVYDPNEAVLASAPAAAAADADALRAAADQVRLGLAGSLASYRFTTHTGELRSGAQIDYGGQPAGYARQPGEVVNYVENHDNPTLWDQNAFKLPLATPAAERARVQVLGLALVLLSQGVPYFHAGTDLLRSKSMDRNSYDSGDWFNRIDWTAADNHFGSGLPPAADNAAFYPLIAPRLANAQLKPGPADIAFARDAFRDLLRIRASTRLLRLTGAAGVQRRLVLHNTGPGQNPVLIAGELDGSGLAGAGFARLLYLVNVDKQAQALTLPAARGQPWRLHPVHRAPGAADRRAATQAHFDPATGLFSVPARTAVVYVQP